MELKEWIVQFVKHRDIFRKSIEKIEEKGSEVIVTYKNNYEHILISPILTDAVPKLDDKRNMSIVTLNTKANLDSLLTNWQKLVQHASLTVYFVNPESQTEQKWIIRPHMHSKIADEDSLKPGLVSMFSMVEEA
jgi:hypothetical protein